MYELQVYYTKFMAKTLIIHDRFQFRGGAERLVLDLAKILDTDIVTEFWTDTTYPKSEVPHSLTVLDTGEPRMMVWRYVRAQWNFWWKTRKIIKDYDVIIFSGNNCLSAALRPLSGKRIVYYCHTPVRYVYDLLHARRNAEPSVAKRMVYYDIGKFVIRFWYRLGLSRMQTVITNSQNVHDRLLKFCKKESHIIYPPINTQKFSWIEQGDYYLSFGRLDSLKRIDDIVRAFQKMPEKKLVIASGGEDAGRIAELAKGFSNITLVGWVDDGQLKDLVGNCIATIYIPIDEDFGMTAVEGMSAGKPCIGVDEGGLKETIIPGKTGTLIPQAYRVDDLVVAVQNMTPERAFTMRADCEAQAQRFSLEKFESEMRGLIMQGRVSNPPVRGRVSVRIAIDASRSIDGVQKTGVEVVSDALLKYFAQDTQIFEENDAMSRAHKILSSAKDPSQSSGSPHTYITYYTPKQIPWLPANAQRIITRHHLWTIIGLSLAMLRDKPDVLFVPVHTLPFFCPKKTIRIIHDVSFLRTPQAYSLRERTYMRFDLWRAKRLCSNIVVPTEAVKRDLVDLLHFSAEKIVVTGWGVPEGKFEVESEKFEVSGVFIEKEMQKKNIRSLQANNLKLHTPQSFILFLGRVEEKKNVANMIRAFELFKRTHPKWEFILAGKPGFGFEHIAPLLETSGVRYLGYVSDEVKADLLGSASMLTLISREEGFAFPMLEAFRAHIPVLASSIPTLAEIAEDAALFADPDDVQKIADNMSLLADNVGVRVELINKGTEKLKKYSWDTVLKEVWELFLN